jgi:acid phosphatase (class B)
MLYDAQQNHFYRLKGNITLLRTLLCMLCFYMSSYCLAANTLPAPHFAPDVHWITVPEIEKSLKDTPPMNVGFDIDDTLLTPKAAFEIAFGKHCPLDHTHEKHSCKKEPHFWDTLNSTASTQLTPTKAVAKALIDMHKRRGDTIYFITAREKGPNKNETLSQFLRSTFQITHMQPVIFVGMKGLDREKPAKAPAIQKNNIQIFYGDADGDIAAAKHSNIRGIRVIRHPSSQDSYDMPINGLYGEEVIRNSEL